MDERLMIAIQRFALRASRGKKLVSISESEQVFLWVVEMLARIVQWLWWKLKYDKNIISERWFERESTKQVQTHIEADSTIYLPVLIFLLLKRKSHLTAMCGYVFYSLLVFHFKIIFVTYFFYPQCEQVLLKANVVNIP